MESMKMQKNMQEGEILLGITLGFGTVQTLICC